MATSRTRELAVYDGRDCIGTIKVAADGQAVAFDRDGKRLGKFPTYTAASAVFDKLAKSEAGRTSLAGSARPNSDSHACGDGICRRA